jgi:hypothetical protein
MIFLNTILMLENIRICILVNVGKTHPCKCRKNRRSKHDEEHIKL